jgi:thiol-disulfide isomerase/thioredoxin
MKILKFYASWCGPCKMQTEYLEQVTGADIIEIDVEEDDNEDLIIKHKVRSLPKLVIINDKDEVIKEFVGLTPVEKIQEVIDNVSK